ncbi:receptor-type tyrosine-protein phosphatase epsilon-like [Branchiostoma floridae]|uniref:protein-tyrosine-phosphatase n=1 Tax=Branchiostoma floridae TaxID=7739 RepID=A0A9J7NC88_BRAFL|nr:receptor-type tyrosine-protein phosphatase epsilon-like [Branchiostoma floridae]
MNLTDSKPGSTSFQVSLPQVSQRSGPISCYQVIVVKMNKGETLEALSGRLGEPNDILTSSAEEEGKTVPYVAMAFSGGNIESDPITVGKGEDCTDSCCRVGVVDGAPEPGNKELSPGTVYTTVIRAHVDTSQGRRRKRAISQAHTSSSYSKPVTTDAVSSQAGAIVGGILAAVAVLCIVGVGLFFYRRRLAGKDDNPLRIPRRPPTTRRTAKEDDTQLGAIGGMEEEAVEVKKSPAPKHKPKPHRPSRRGGASPSLDLRQPIPIQRLEREFARRHANDDQLFVEEYSSLPKPFGREHAEAYYNEENASRNKFRNIIAYDRGLVRLTPIEGVPGSGYIHASYMDGYQEKNKFIAAQGPMDNTIDDFWRMIWETGSTAIVMVTNLEENGKKKCSQYWPKSGEKTYASDLVVRLEDTVKMVDHVTRTLLLRKAGERRVRKVTHFHFIGWPDFGLPKSPMGLLKFHKTVMSALTPRDRPIVVHCSAGVGRTGTFITVDAMLDMIRAEGKVDVFGFVEQMRQNRSFMVQTEGQYVFIFKAILEYYLYGDTETEVSNIHRYMQNLKKEDPQTGKTGLETEFGKLTRIPVDKANMRSGNLPENLSKNRVLQVLPYDTTRVFLQQKPGVKGADYINASFIDGYNMKDAYIATQGPLDRTVEDFWRMVWEWNSCSIVMITEIKEKGQNKCAMYWPEEGSQAFGDYTVSLQDQTDYQDYTLRTLHLTKGQGGQTRTVQQFHFHGWPEVGIPDNAAGMIDLIGQVQKQQQHSGNGPITVHCSAGAGRTGAFCAISTVLERVKAEGVCDVFQVVKTLRLQRPHMVQTLDQYQFCYQAVVEYLDSFDHYANFR